MGLFNYTNKLNDYIEKIKNKGLIKNFTFDKSKKFSNITRMEIKF